MKLRDRAREKLLLAAAHPDDPWRLDSHMAGLARLLTCLYGEHRDQPRHFLWRFANRPWRCSRCGTWLMTQRYVAPGASWYWREIDDIASGPDPVEETVRIMESDK